MQINGDAHSVTVEQLGLLLGPDQPFVVGTNHRENDQPIFVFGRTRTFSALLHDEGISGKVKYKNAIWRYLQQAADLRVYALTYSVLKPMGRPQFVSVAACWPCTEDLFRKAQAVGFDFTRNEAPLEELQELISQIVGSTPEGDDA